MTFLYSAISWLLIAAVAVLGGLLALPYLPIPGNYEVRIVQSGSMEPAIRTGSVVFVKPSGSYAVGDVITFERAGARTPTTHRVSAVEGAGAAASYRTKGDANENEDAGSVARGEVIGRVFLTIPFLGYLLDFAKQPLGFVLLIVLPALIVVGEEVAKILREVRAGRGRPEEAPQNV